MNLNRFVARKAFGYYAKAKPPTKAQLSAHYRELQRKSAAARWGKVDPDQRKAAMAALARARWDKRKATL